MPTRQARILTAIAIALASGLVAYFAGRRQGAVPDFLYPWTGARLFLSGIDPYAAMGGHRGAAPPYDEALFYPFTALVALFPIAKIRYEIAGPLFFGAAQKATSQMRVTGTTTRVLIIRLDHVPAMDATGLVALESALTQLRASGCRVILCGLQSQPAGLLKRAGIDEIPGQLAIRPDLGTAITHSREMMAPSTPHIADSAL